MGSDEWDLRRAAADGDGEAMYRVASELEAHARRLENEARQWYERSFDANSLDGIHALVRLRVADDDYGQAQLLLRMAVAGHPDEPPRRFISVAPDVLGRDVSLEGNDVAEVLGAGDFTVISPEPERAAAAVARVAPRLMDVDALGAIQSPYGQGPDNPEARYTPNWLDDVQVCRYGAAVGLDTKGMMWSAMGRTIVAILVGALTEDRVPAHVAGYCPGIHAELRVWKGSKHRNK